MWFPPKSDFETSQEGAEEDEDAENMIVCI